ncbi:hypothetical protein [Nocardia sp. BMG111209]|uniref:hypothetical protein n=1 Tax=Nocardia sp. BMG111209 TaxID=1160137 RepID=UPI00036E5097|nr:hypothetical protein [Nocardia sp. BMG111209]
MLWLIFFVPVVCWLIAARDRALRIGIGLGLLVTACAEVALLHGWIFADERFTATVACAIVVAVLLVCGWSSDEPDRSVRAIAGAVLIFGCSLCSLLAALVGVAAFLSPHVEVPADDVLLPLPAGLVVTGDTTEPCDGGATTYCSRTFEIAGSATVADRQVFDRVMDRLETTHGWSPHYDAAGEVWTDCRTRGWWLDRRIMCVRVHRGDLPGQPPVTVSFESESRE